MPVHVSTQNDGETIAVASNDSIVVSLPESMDGYRWELDAPSTLLSLQEDTYLPQSSQAGGQTIRRLTYRATHPGTEPVRFKLCRDWSGEEAKRFAINVNVK